ncbi:hypothetical protein DMH26_04230 [Streptomyces sp. WAC 05379]|uniref:hypothetical protein n=1 Tax=Streptomyces sp. WAC 05379 TaxID=2203207 RepID=UPI000F73F391|nr:hypothetical protein [Streptomyces sp. WAC 05379]RSO07745.1 hypothetical protein DMH26_04230 [Streptomyces sp. WAC 05379]
MKRIGVVMSGVAMGCAALTACSPAERPLAAAWLDDDGVPMVAIRPCGTDRVGPLALRDSPETRPESLTAADYAGWETSLDKDAIGARTFELFSPPRSWHAETRGPQVLRPRRSYQFMAYGGTSGFSNYNIELHFTSDDLSDLRTGQVWAEGRAMSRREFEELADDSC